MTFRRRTASPSCASLKLLLLTSMLLGCQQAELEATRSSLDDLASRLDSIDAQLEASQATLTAIESSEARSSVEVSTQLAEISSEIAELPVTLESICPEMPDAPSLCPEAPSVQRVIVSADKMLVGELEHVWIDPPGATLVARIDTGATSSSLHASNIVQFERDGDDWVRFDMPVRGSESITVERPIIRFVRVIQQADPSGSRRPVVAMRARLGDVQDTFEFTLADRSHLENELILGRNFLTDVTLVDVGKQFIQPRYQPQ